jgi:hypothetical protein
MSASAESAKHQRAFLTRAAGISEDDLVRRWEARPAAAPAEPFATPSWQPDTEGAETDDAADDSAIVTSVAVAVALLQRIAEDPLLRPSHRVAARRHLRQIERTRSA